MISLLRDHIRTADAYSASPAASASVIKPAPPSSSPTWKRRTPRRSAGCGGAPARHSGSPRSARSRRAVPKRRVPSPYPVPVVPAPYFP
ncbi:hypothetical protein AMK24_09650 [Streptomyces sp. CB02366]|nr:hypothetical protein AMK24_09650 [Streptomyces sp. CB02366]